MFGRSFGILVVCFGVPLSTGYPINEIKDEIGSAS